MLATEEWLTPKGRVIWHQGISPDVLVSLAPEVTPLIPENERGMTEVQFRATEDEQLLRALDLLKQQRKQETQSTTFTFKWFEAGRWEKTDLSVIVERSPTG